MFSTLLSLLSVSQFFNFFLTFWATWMFFFLSQLPSIVVQQIGNNFSLAEVL
jgi:hypothetical protein